MEFKLMQPGQEEEVIALVREVFTEIVAPGYSEQGLSEFYHYANSESLIGRSKNDHFTVLALEDETIYGAIEIRAAHHVSMFFVRSQHHNHGIGRALLADAITRIATMDSDIRQLTVNASINAVAAYKNFGFTVGSEEQCRNGIRYVPMELRLHEERPA
ncbi:GNAT family N-acetyltransferase [Desulfogranum mediterraneum]|uniref:GNAT family N-acetyltransferase n=1 Tax=Desulfogranum mediterraneum TaxID=160661 RepID=UPI00040C1CFB|nr:GNAT family N-acetyltransferase [Desulfogranum mediterraneum]